MVHFPDIDFYPDAVSNPAFQPDSFEPLVWMSYTAWLMTNVPLGSVRPA